MSVVTIGADSNFSGYLATPASGRGPGIIVMQEIFGANSVMRDVADDFAARGYFALVPDFFWRIQPGIQLTDKSDAEIQTAIGYGQRYDVAKGISDVQAAVTQLRKHPGVSGKVGTVGYCLGGLLAYLSAAETDADANVGYYAVRVQDHLAAAANVARPLMLHIAEADTVVPPPAQEKIIASLKFNPHATLHLYPGMGHAFARIGGMHYDKANADLANSRTAAFFQQHLG